MTTTESELYYDPYDFEIDTDPYPVWKRLRDAQPLYYNERYDFFALSRFDDVDQCARDWETYISSKGTLLELIKADFVMPPGSIIFEDPPAHNIHRRLLSRVFTPRNINALEPKIREFCARSLDPLVGGAGFDFIADIGAQMPMRTIGMLLGIPEADQEAIRDRIDEGLRLTDGAMPDFGAAFAEVSSADGFAEYIDWRATHPSDDLMTDLLQAEFEDETGTVRRLTREEVLGYVNLIAAAGNETTTRLIGWTGKVLAEHPDQRRELVEDRSLVANAIEELLRYESPSPVQARYVTRDVEHHGQPVPAGSAILLLNASSQSRRAEVLRCRPVRHSPHDRHPPGLRVRHPLLPRIGAGPARRPDRPGRDPPTVPRLGGRLGPRRAGADLDRARLGEAPGADGLTH